MKTLLFSFLITVTSLTAHASNMVSIPSGAFQMGCSVNDSACENDEGKAGGITVTVPAFEIDIHEVTVAKYEKCMAAGKCTKPKDYARNNYCNVGEATRAKHPANCVDWQEAVDYCSFAGKRLPTEAEWEKAARGKVASRYYWGEQASCKHAILDDKVTTGSVANEKDGCGEDRTWEVGSQKPNAYGLYDMSGNAGEWTSVWYGKKGLQQYAQGNLNGPTAGTKRVVRGGSWDENPDNLRVSFRNLKLPASGSSIYGSIGFRCAK